jgi:hypothetical protein
VLTNPTKIFVLVLVLEFVALDYEDEDDDEEEVVAALPRCVHRRPSVVHDKDLPLVIRN